MQYNTATLSNGLRIIHLPSASPVVYCGYEIAAGAAKEDHEHEGLAHFCEHTTFKGTARRSALDIINCLESVGGDLNAFTTKTDTVYYAAILNSYLPRAVELLTDIVFHSTYPQKEIDKEVEVICDEIESYNDSPAELIFDEFENIIFKGTPLGHNILGDAARVRKYTTADALEFTKRYYRPDNAIFFAYGNINFAELKQEIEEATASPDPSEGGEMEVTSLAGSDSSVKKNSANEHFSLAGSDASMNQNSDNEHFSISPPSEGLGEAPEGSGEAAGRTFIVRRSTHQAHVMLGTRAYGVNDDRRMALYLLNNILGGPGMNARLNLNLREKHGLVYTVESSMINYATTGLWSVYFGCDPHDVDECLKLIREELDKVIDSPLTDEQLAAAKQQIKGQIGIACDNRESFALDFGKSFLHYGWEKDVNKLYARIDALTSKQLQDVARDIFPKERLTTLIFE